MVRLSFPISHFLISRVKMTTENKGGDAIQQVRLQSPSNLPTHIPSLRVSIALKPPPPNPEGRDHEAT